VSVTPRLGVDTRIDVMIDFSSPEGKRCGVGSARAASGYARRVPSVFTRIMLPLSLPILAVTVYFSFTAAWNNFLGPLIYLNTGEKYPMIMALKFFEQSLSKEAPLFHYMMAMTTMMSFPLLMLYFFMQRTLIEGITAGAVKG